MKRTILPKALRCKTKDCTHRHYNKSGYCDYCIFTPNFYSQFRTREEIAQDERNDDDNFIKSR